MSEEVREKKEWKKIPAGDYEAVAKKYTEKKNSKGTGRNASIMYVITEGEYKDHGVFMNLNNIIHSKSPQAQEIGQKALNEVLLATGVKGGLDNIERVEIQELIEEKPVVITVDTKPAQEYTDYQGNTKMSKEREYVKQVTPL